MVFFFDSHPVQYKVPVYQRLQEQSPDSFQVIYATDCSVRGHRDVEFGKDVAWDIPLLAGYRNLILHNERGVPLSGFRSLTGRGIYRLLKSARPKAVLLSQFRFEADMVTYLSCLFLGIPLWIRHETQDEAFHRSTWKKGLRNVIYRAVYYPLKHAFFIGQLNREHLIRHGVSPQRMSFAPYCTASPAESMSDEARHRLRESCRSELGVSAGETLVLFSGKLIEKKNPSLILQALGHLTENERGSFKVVFVGAGELEASLVSSAEAFPGRVHFAGFVNQSRITEYYLAADILVLPSRRAGETWGLVVNEALQVGCAVVMTEAVGCHREFGSWERVRVIREGAAEECAQALRELSKFPRSFDWCEEKMKRYGIRAAAEALAREIDLIEGQAGGHPQ